MRIPPFKDVELNKFFIDLNKELENIRKETVSNITGNRSVLLVSPDLKVWEVTVTNVGALVVTKVAG
jgi:hypothetical protein